jgi:hypothetical protein
MSLTKEELLDVLRSANRQGYLGGGGGGASGGGGAGGNAGGNAGGAAGETARLGEAALRKLSDVAGTTGEVLYDSFKKVADQNFTVADAAGGMQKIFSEMGGPGRVLGTVMGDLGKYGYETVERWREVSKFGASFGNDAVGFRAGAAQTRMSFDEYTNFLSKNKESIIGLGGSVTESAKAFNKLSKGFLDQDFGDQLRQMGMNTVEVNEALALQVGFQKSTLAGDEKSQARAQQAAFDLAEEMDALAKLTGKSRQEQAESLKKAQADMQVEAKMRLIGIKEGPEAEAKARSMYAKQYAEAEARGQGQMFKEVFATGQVQTKEAGMQIAIQGEAAMATVKQARATAAGDAEAAKKANASANEEMYKLQKSTSYLSIAVNSTGEAAKAAQAGMTANNNRYQALQAIELENRQKGVTMTSAQLNAEAELRVKRDQQGKDKEGKDIAGAQTTKAMVDLESRAKDAGAALNEHMVKPLNDALGKSIYEFRNKVDEKGRKNDLLANKNAEGVNARQSYGAPMAAIKDMLLGEDQAAQPKTVTDPKTGKEHNVPTAIAAEKDKKSKLGLVEKLSGMTVTDMVVTNLKTGVARSRGSLGETGNLFENFGSGTMAMLHGKESVVTEDQMKSLIKGVQTSNIEGMLKNLSTSMGTGKDQSGIDIGSLSRDFSTSISSPRTSTPSRDFSTSISSPRTSTPSMGGIKSVADQIQEKFKMMEQQGSAATDAKKQGADNLDIMSNKDTSLSDLGDKLDLLNTTMNQLVAISTQSVEVSNKQVKATKGLSGNLFA